MRRGEPIYDSFIDPITKEQIILEKKGFIDVERHLLESRGWRFNPETGAYHPPLNQ
jgi:hypothetical protein